MTPADLVEKKVGEVLDKHPEATVKRVMPVILLLLARDCGFDKLRPKVKEALADVVGKLQVSEDMPSEEIERRIKELVTTLDVPRALLKDLESVFDTIDLEEKVEASDRSSKFLGSRAAHETAPKTTDEAPEDSEKGASFVMNQTGRIG